MVKAEVERRIATVFSAEAVAYDRVTSVIGPGGVTGERVGDKHWLTAVLQWSALLAYFFGWFALIAWKNIHYALYKTWPCSPPTAIIAVGISACNPSNCTVPGLSHPDVVRPMPGSALTKQKRCSFLYSREVERS